MVFFVKVVNYMSGGDDLAVGKYKREGDEVYFLSQNVVLFVNVFIYQGIQRQGVSEGME